MNNEKNPAEETPKKKVKLNKLTIVLSCVAGALLILLIVMLVMLPGNDDQEATVPTETTVPAESETTAVPETTIPAETEPVMLENMAELYAQNPDIVGWVRIDDTKLDYPVMYTPDDEEKYIRANFEGNYDIAGLPFIDKDCSVDPESDNLIMYGHNMNNGTGFATIMKYAQKSFWEEHPTIYYSTLYEERTYEIIAAFYDRVYYSYEDVFKFYQFIDAEDEEDFNYAMEQYQDKALYDTGVTAEYGDQLITLVTCSYHHDYGRFVLVARAVSEDVPEEVVEPVTEEISVETTEAAE